MIPRVLRQLPRFCVAIAVVFPIVGCAGRAAYQQGVEAEKRGEAHLAYAYYAKAAQSSPDSQAYDRAIRRLGPLAATHWVTEARLARAEGRYSDAWRACMRSLAIQPDRPEALAFYDDLMREHSARLAGVEREWKKKGGQALTIEVSPQAPSQQTGAPDPRPTTQDPDASESRSRSAKRHAPEPQSAVAPDSQTSEFLAIHKLSRDDHREVNSVDGLRIRLRRTTRDQTVDLDLYDGEQRIQRIRDLKAGDSRLLNSPKGKWYRLSILKVNDASNSAEIGLNPA